LTPTDPNVRTHRLQAFAAAALVNFFQTTEADTFDSVLPTVFAQLLKLLENGTNFVKGNALEAMTLLARYMEEKFTPVSRDLLFSLHERWD
jgi:hypothetical protein